MLACAQCPSSSTRSATLPDKEEGTLPPDTDVEGLLGVQNCLVYGYILFRDGFARQLNVDREALDRRMRRLVSAVGRRAREADWSAPAPRMPDPPPMQTPLLDTTTPGLLQASVLDLLAERGILAGVNLRQVAERAGVHRALVYHYFGSRRELLLAALRQRRPPAAAPASRGSSSARTPSPRSCAIPARSR